MEITIVKSAVLFPARLRRTRERICSKSRNPFYNLAPMVLYMISGCGFRRSRLFRDLRILKNFSSFKAEEP